jgi:branched-chain amino acid transport system permease protein
MPQLLDGIIVGAIITLGAVGLSMVFGILRFPNFGHGDIMTLGAYFGLLLGVTVLPSLGVPDARMAPLSFGLSFLVGILPAMLLTGGVVVAIDFLVFRRLRQRRASPVLMAIAALGVGLMLRAVVFLGWGSGFQNYSVGLRTVYNLPLGLQIRPDQIFILAAAVVLVVGLYLFLEKSKMGKALRATADNPDLARVSGINTDRMIIWTWLIAGGLAAAGGMLLGLQGQVRPLMGWDFLLPLFAAVILGGIGNPYGALVGGLVIGIAQETSTIWIQPSYKPAVAFMILIIILLVRPRGIFGARYAY